MLNVSAPANVVVTLKHPAGSPISVSFDGVAQTYDTSKTIGQIVVAASSLIIDESVGTVMPRLGGTFTPIAGSASSLKIVSGDTPANGQYQPGAIFIDGVTLGTGTLNNLEIDGGSGSFTFLDAVPTAPNFTFVGRSGSDSLIVDASSGPVNSPTTLNFNSTGVNNSLIVLGPSGNDQYTLAIGHVDIDSARINVTNTTMATIGVTDNSGINSLLVDMSNGNPIPPNNPVTYAAYFNSPPQSQVNVILGGTGQTLNIANGGSFNFLNIIPNNSMSFPAQCNLTVTMTGNNNALLDSNVPLTYIGGTGKNSIRTRGTAKVIISSPSSISQIVSFATSQVELTASSGTSTVDNVNAGSGTGTQLIVDSGAIVNVTGNYVSGNTVVTDSTADTLTVNGRLNMSSLTMGPTLTVKTLTIASSGLLDLGKSFLYVDNTFTPFTAIHAYINSGYHINPATGYGDYNGVTGITSFDVKAHTDHLSVGYYNGALQDPNNPDYIGQKLGPNSNSGQGTGIPFSQILIRPTLTGDLNGDGFDNSYDSTLFNTFGLFSQPTALGWQAGDLNGDGIVDSKDVNIFNSSGNYNNGRYS